jgi:hypothetical protein
MASDSGARESRAREHGCAAARGGSVRHHCVPAWLQGGSEPYDDGCELLGPVAYVIGPSALPPAKIGASWNPLV